ncbi:protein chibby homolog 1-like [Salarias fasciatus]|uniref:protein chibby homolog 1-like n=1 Tax=Salarias fasciatus TaxID=181472 RepID=UPI001176F010|nr:protein chibby homolog 1-like [Salarias fasciatus]
MLDLRGFLKKLLFGDKFSPKKVPPRKPAHLSSLHQLDRCTREMELGLEFGPPSMTIGGQSWKFEDGQWLAEPGGNASNREMRRMKKRNVQLEEENNLLKLKTEILMDMLTETTMDFHTMEKEVDDLKAQRRRKK